jgi:outer membrane protein OmpA-like peptidoglycan-associated protein/osmotically-inducible protein OsmY/uncharacterized protein (DUF3820 family)
MWGLIPLTMLLWLAMMGEHQAIQADLRLRAGEKLASAGLPWASAGFTGRDGVLIGHTTSEEERRRAAEVANTVWGVRVVDNHAVLSLPRNLLWSALRESETVRLTGYVPSEDARGQLVEMARSRFPNHSIDDRMVVARLAEERPEWMSGARFAMGQLGRLSSGRVELEGHQLAVEGRAGTTGDYRLVRRELAQSLPGGIRLKDEKVLPPTVSPYGWGATYRNNQLELTGHVPDERQRDEIFAHAKRTFPKATIIDRMVTATGEPRDWQLAVMRAMSRLAELLEGQIENSDHKLVLRGIAEKEQTASRVSRALREQVPPSFEVHDQITFRQPAIPTVDPYVTVVELSEAGGRLTGHVPGEDARAAVLSAIKAVAKGPVRDDTQLGAGADKGWLACLKAGLGGLARIGGGKLVLTNRRLDLSGQTSDEALIEETTATVRAATNRTCDLVAKIALIELPEPDLTWSAHRDADGLSLVGEVPDKATQGKLVARAKELFPSIPVRDQTTVKSALSAKWPQVAMAGLDILAKLREGTAGIEGQVLTISGEAPDTVTAAAVKESLKRDLPHGYKGVDTVRVRSAAMLWADKEAKRKAADDARRKLEAEEAEREARKRADEEARAEQARKQEAAARKAAEEQARQADAQRRVQAARKAEADRRAASEREPARLSTPPAATTETSRTAATLAERRRRETARRAAELAEADTGRAVAALQRDMAKGASGAVDEQDRKLRLGETCREAMRTTVRKGRISFARGRADLTPESYPTLRRLARMVQVCNAAVVEIEGHADSDGPAGRNKLLSQRRARAVMRYLIKSGIDAGRLKAIGYGEARPAVPNTTKANKAFNRRIDFTVRMN